MNSEERAQILALAHDVPLVWHAATTTAAERKHLLRLLIKDVTLTNQATAIALAVRWQTAACTTLDIPRPKRAADAKRTSPAVVTRVRELVLTQTDEQIAVQLNTEHFRSGSGGTFTTSKVQWIRFVHHLKSGCPQGPAAGPTGQRGEGRYSVRAAATLLNVTIYTIADWCQAGKLDGGQSVPHGPWGVSLTLEQIATLRKPRLQHWRRSQRETPEHGCKPAHP